MSITLCVILSWQLILSCGLPQHSHKLGQEGGDPGEPLYLTTYLEKGDITEARRQAQVTLNDSLQIVSYAGFFTVNKKYHSNQFVWYFPSMSSDKETAPVLVWLQGGPGVSSLFGLFCENGPLFVQNGQFKRREYHWALNHHVIYIDNPVGAGFSFTNKVAGLCTNEVQVGEALYSTITQFFQLFPELQQNDFYITGESYAGKYVPAFAHTILKKASKINLKGLVVGGAFINPESQNHYRSGSYLQEGRRCHPVKSDDDFVSVLNQNAVRKALHVGSKTYTELNFVVHDNLKHDFNKSMAPWLSELLDYYPVTLYGGEYDNIVPYAGIVDFLQNHFNFTGADEYKSAKYYSWRVDGELAGCVRHAHLLTDIYVLNATHFVPYDQPKRAWDMITRITHGKGFDKREICPVTPQ